MAWARPDVPLSPGPSNVYVDPLQAAVSPGPNEITETQPTVGLAAAPPVDTILVSTPWSASTYWPLGAVVTPGNPVGYAAAAQVIYSFCALMPGTSGAVAPAWTDQQGTVVQDGEVRWMNMGFYLP